MKSKLISIASIANMVFFLFYLFAFTKKENQATINFEDKVLKVRGIVVVDSLGIERVIVGAHLPEPNFEKGYRIAARGKGGSVSGVMLYDHEGQERGGYVTDDGFGNAFLTLDSKTSQQMLLLAEPQGSATFKLWDRSNNSVNLSVGDEAVIELTNKGKKIKLHENENK